MNDESPPLSKPRILVVEDDEATRYLAVSWLTREGYEVDACYDAESALERLRDVTYGALVTDFHLPGMTGLELASSVIGQKLFRASQIVIVSSAPPVKEAAAIGVGTLRKPVDIQTLADRIEALLGGTAAGELAPRSAVRPVVHLLLYVSAGSAASARAQRAAWQFAHRPGCEHVHLEVRDVSEHPTSVAAHRIAFTPTLLRLDPAPSLRIIGDLRDERVLLDVISVGLPP